MTEKFIPQEKLSKKAKKALNAQKRIMWAFSPESRRIESKKKYDRKKDSRSWRDDAGRGSFCFCE